MPHSQGPACKAMQLNDDEIRCHARVGFKGTITEYMKIIESTYPGDKNCIYSGKSTYKYRFATKWGQVGCPTSDGKFYLLEYQCENDATKSDVLCEKCQVKQRKFLSGSSPLKCHWDGVIGEKPPSGSLFIQAIGQKSLMGKMIGNPDANDE